MNKVGIAFGGGGARGIAHIGVLRVLRDCGDCAPCMTTGTSAGSIVAALYAAGSSQEEIEAALDDFDWYHRVIDLSDTMRNMIGSDRGGIVSNRKLGDAVNKLIGRCTFDDLEIDCAVVASDLVHLRRVIFTSRRVARRIDHAEMERFLPPPADGRPGCETMVVTDCTDVGLAVRASCAVPGVFQPVRFGEMRLVDGGVFNQVPVDVVRAMGSQVTIGVGLGMPYYPRRFSGIGATIAAQIAAAGIAQHRRSLELADIGFTVEGIDAFSPLRARHHALLDLGQKSMQNRMERLRELATAN